MLENKMSASMTDTNDSWMMTLDSARVIKAAIDDGAVARPIHLLQQHQQLLKHAPVTHSSTEHEAIGLLSARWQFPVTVTTRLPLKVRDSPLWAFYILSLVYVVHWVDKYCITGNDNEAEQYLAAS